MNIKKAVLKYFKNRKVRKQNKKLIKEFPFLLPHNRWTDEVAKDYDYSYTELDAMPNAWREKFGIQMCRELKEALIEANYLNEYRIIQIKEKYGELRWYDNGHTEKMGQIIHKYSLLSMCYCIYCGKPVRYVTSGWIEYVCEDCKNADIAERHIVPEHFIRLTEEDIPHTYEYTSNGERVEKKYVDYVDFKKLWGLD